MAMRVKHLNLKVEPKGKFFDRVGRKLAVIDRGQAPEKEEESLSFESLEAFRKILTPKRMELLRVIRHEKPSSIYELAKMVRRDIKNVRGDIAMLKDLGLVELKNGRRIRTVVIPRVNYDELKVAIAI
jgi:predicted transcriptional regulator